MTEVPNATVQTSLFPSMHYEMHLMQHIALSAYQDFFDGSERLWERQTGGKVRYLPTDNLATSSFIALP